MRTTEERKQIAQAIIEQLGGAQFRLMTGAKDFLALDSGLRFSLPIGKWRKVEVILNDDDLYDVRFLMPRQGKRDVTQSHQNIYDDGLAQLISNETGLELRLPRISRAR